MPSSRVLETSIVPPCPSTIDRQIAEGKKHVRETVRESNDLKVQANQRVIQ